MVQKINKTPNLDGIKKYILYIYFFLHVLNQSANFHKVRIRFFEIFESVEKIRILLFSSRRIILYIFINIFDIFLCHVVCYVVNIYIWTFERSRKKNRAFYSKSQ